eukprot:1154465-Pelagomonas_calceolata.AAC.1
MTVAVWQWLYARYSDSMIVAVAVWQWCLLRCLGSEMLPTIRNVQCDESRTLSNLNITRISSHFKIA